MLVNRNRLYYYYLYVFRSFLISKYNHRVSYGLLNLRFLQVYSNVLRSYKNSLVYSVYLLLLLLKKYPKIQIKTSNKVYHIKQVNKLSYVCYSSINKHNLFFFFDKFITCTLPQDPLYENTLVSVVNNKKLNNEVIFECSFKNLFNFLEIEQFFDDRQERFFIDNYNFLNIKFFFNDYFFFNKIYIKASVLFFFNFFRFPIKYK